MRIFTILLVSLLIVSCSSKYITGIEVYDYIYAEEVRISHVTTDEYGKIACTCGTYEGQIEVTTSQGVVRPPAATGSRFFVMTYDTKTGKPLQFMPHYGNSIARCTGIGRVDDQFYVAGVYSGKSFSMNEDFVETQGNSTTAFYLKFQTNDPLLYSVYSLARAKSKSGVLEVSGVSFAHSRVAMVGKVDGEIIWASHFKGSYHDQNCNFLYVQGTPETQPLLYFPNPSDHQKDLSLSNVYITNSSTVVVSGSALTYMKVDLAKSWKICQFIIRFDILYSKRGKASQLNRTYTQNFLASNVDSIVGTVGTVSKKHPHYLVLTGTFENVFATEVSYGKGTYELEATAAGPRDGYVAYFQLEDGRLYNMATTGYPSTSVLEVTASVTKSSMVTYIAGSYVGVMIAAGSFTIGMIPTALEDGILLATIDSSAQWSGATALQDFRFYSHFATSMTTDNELDEVVMCSYGGLQVNSLAEEASGCINITGFESVPMDDSGALPNRGGSSVQFQDSIVTSSDSNIFVSIFVGILLISVAIIAVLVGVGAIVFLVNRQSENTLYELVTTS